MAEKMTSAAGVEGSRWESALYGSVGGLLVVLIATIGFLINRRKAKASQPWEASTKQSRNVKTAKRASNHMSHRRGLLSLKLHLNVSWKSRSPL